MNFSLFLKLAIEEIPFQWVEIAIPSRSVIAEVHCMCKCTCRLINNHSKKGSDNCRWPLMLYNNDTVLVQIWYFFLFLSLFIFHIIIFCLASFSPLEMGLTKIRVTIKLSTFFKFSSFEISFLAFFFQFLVTRKDRTWWLFWQFKPFQRVKPIETQTFSSRNHLHFVPRDPFFKILKEASIGFVAALKLHVDVNRNRHCIAYWLYSYQRERK